MKNINLIGSKKLKPKFIGPFSIEELIGAVAYHLKLPPSMDRIHPTFHVGLLKHYIPGGDGQAKNTNPAVDYEGNEEYEVEKIVEARGIGRRKKFRVCWLGYDETHDSWLTSDELTNAPKVMAAWNAHT